MAEESGPEEPRPPVESSDAGRLVTHAIGLSVASMKEHEEGAQAATFTFVPRAAETKPEARPS